MYSVSSLSPVSCIVVSARILRDDEISFFLTSSRNSILLVSIFIRVAYLVGGNWNNRLGALPIESDTLVHNLLVTGGGGLGLCWRSSFLKFKNEFSVVYVVLGTAGISLEVFT